jgi:hypothetical protein
MDLYSFSKLDRDPHSPEKLDPDLQKVIADRNYSLRRYINISQITKC